MISLGLLLVGVADLLERGRGPVTPSTLCGSISKLKRDTSTTSLVTSGRVPVEPRRWPSRSSVAGRLPPLDSLLRRYDARATFRSSTPSSEPRSFCRKAGWVWMKSSLTVAIERSSISPRLIPMRTLESKSMVSSLEIVWAVLSTP